MDRYVGYMMKQQVKNSSVHMMNTNTVNLLQSQVTNMGFLLIIEIRKIKRAFKVISFEGFSFVFAPATT